MTVKYTDGMIAELKAIKNLNYASATVFADKYGINVRSVIAKSRALEIPYTAKTPGEKTKPKAVVKSDVVTQIERKLGAELPSLSKMTSADLAKLNEILG